METEIVGWLADRQEAMRAHAKTLPYRRQRTGAIMIVGAMMTVACIAALVFELVERAVVKSTTSAEIFAAKLCVAFAALLEGNI
jgi:hypothetical protein